MSELGDWSGFVSCVHRIRKPEVRHCTLFGPLALCHHCACCLRAGKTVPVHRRVCVCACAKTEDPKVIHFILLFGRWKIVPPSQGDARGVFRIIDNQGRGTPPPILPPPTSPYQSDCSGKNEIYNRENLVGPFWGGPHPPTPPLKRRPGDAWMHNSPSSLDSLGTLRGWQRGTAYCPSRRKLRSACDRHASHDPSVRKRDGGQNASRCAAQLAPCLSGVGVPCRHCHVMLQLVTCTTSRCAACALCYAPGVITCIDFPLVPAERQIETRSIMSCAFCRGALCWAQQRISRRKPT